MMIMMTASVADSHESLFLNDHDESAGNFSVDDDWSGKVLLTSLNESDLIIDSSTTTTTRSLFELTLEGVPRSVVEIGTPPVHGLPNSEEALLNRSSVLFVAISFILLMVISLAWLVFYYVQRFRYLHSKERVSRRLAELAKKAVARIPVKTLQPGDRETNSDLDQCAICIEPYRQLDVIRVLPCRHYFHKLCIDPWLLEQRSCPMCKLDILRAYGLRNEFSPTCPSVDGASSGSITVPVLAAAGPQLGLTTSSGSDDGLDQRVALVHSHTRGPSGAGLTYPPLTYVVLTTAADLSSLYYVRPSGSEAPPAATLSSVESADSRSNLISISLLPTDVSDTSVQPQSSNSTVVWNPHSVSPSAITVQSTASHQQHSIDSSIPVHQWPVVGSLLTSASGMPTGTLITTVNYTHPEVTHTTQAFRNPVCSIVHQCESTEPAITTNPIFGSDYYVSDRPGLASSVLYHTAIPSIDLLHTDPTPPCPVTKPPLADRPVVPSPDSCRRVASASNSNRSTRSSSSSNSRLVTPSSFTPTHTRFRSHAARRTSSTGRSPLIAWLLSPWRRTVVVPVSAPEVNPEPSQTSSVATAFSVSQPLLRPALSVAPVPERCSASEQVVFAVVEKEPFNNTSAGSVTDNNGDNNSDAEDNDRI